MSLFNAVLGTVTSSDAFKKASSYVVTGAIEKVKEGTSKIASTLGVNSTFSKIGAALPSVNELVDTTFRGGTSELTSNPFIRQQQQLMLDSFNKMSAAGMDASTNSKDGGPDDHLVKLVEEGVAQVVFRVMPEIVESRTVQYDAIAPAQAPGAFQKFKGTDSTQWTVNATLISRNSAEATENMIFLNTLRGWTKPFFGDTTGAQFPGKLGAPPPVLTFSGLRERIIGPVPVVITSLNWNWPTDVDYLPTSITAGADGSGESSGKFIPFPAVMTIAIQLTESFSTTQFNGFSLADYRQGLMVTAYGGNR